MSGATTAGFNVLTDPWVPLDRGGRVERASFVELLAGEKDAPDLSHPREDVPFFSRMLLSALTQALFAPKDAAELRERVAAPLPRATIEARIDRVREDFELTGARAFLQTGEGDESNDTARLAFDGLGGGVTHLLFRLPSAWRAICAACAVPSLYGAQAFATSGGRGYSPGVRGSPPLTTLLAGGSVRRDAWLNVLCVRFRDRLGYAADGARPWHQPEAREKPGESVGLVEGLFWRPRSAHLRPAEGAACDLCGAPGPLYQITGWGGNHRVAGGSFWHPFTPYAEDPSPKAKKRLWGRNLPADRPSWTELAELVATADGVADHKGRLPHAAPVFSQYVEHLLDGVPASLLVFDSPADKASVLRRVVETFPLSARVRDGEYVSALRVLVEDAERACATLRKALFVALAPSDRGGPFTEELVAAFWQRSEPHFWHAYWALDGGALDFETFRRALVGVCLGLFDEFAEPYQNDPVVLAECVRRRRKLRFDLEVGLRLRDPPAKGARAAKGAAKAPGGARAAKSAGEAPGDARAAKGAGKAPGGARAAKGAAKAGAGGPRAKGRA